MLSFVVLILFVVYAYYWQCDYDVIASAGISVIESSVVVGDAVEDDVADEAGGPGGDDTVQAAATPEGSTGRVPDPQKKINDVNKIPADLQKMYDPLKEGSDN